jgi:hypothetical protein
MARIFGDDVVVNLDDVHNHDTHELVIGGGALEHVATHQGITPEAERALREAGEKEDGKVHKEVVGAR